MFRDALIGSDRKPARVWGEKQQPQETDETRNLDNGGLLQLQKSRMNG